MANSLVLRSAAAMLIAGLTAGHAIAGQFKRLDAVATLLVGGEVVTVNSPLRRGPTMEIDVFEWPSSLTLSGYSCRITANGTGQTLNVALVGLTGAILRICSAPPGGTCGTPSVLLTSNRLFQCTVASQSDGVVAVDGTYTFSVQRTLAIIPTPTQEADTANPTGLVGEQD